MTAVSRDPSYDNRYCLLLDTAAARSAAAVYDMQSMQMVSCVDSLIGKGHAELLLDQVAEALAGAGIVMHDLARIGVTVGPGSFTGLRVGISAARGLALALDIEVVGIETLEALAFPWLRQGGPVLAVQDARRGEVFAALYDVDGGVLAPAAALSPAAAAALVPQDGRLLHIAGSGTELVAPLVQGGFKQLHDYEGLPQVAAIGAIAATRQPGEPVRPLYLRGADAKPQAPVAGIVRTGLPSA